MAIFFPGAGTLGYPGVMGSYRQKTFGVGKGGLSDCPCGGNGTDFDIHAQTSALYQTMIPVIGFAALLTCLVGAQFTEIPERVNFVGSSFPSQAAKPAAGGAAPGLSFAPGEEVRTRAAGSD